MTKRLLLILVMLVLINQHSFCQYENNINSKLSSNNTLFYSQINYFSIKNADSSITDLSDQDKLSNTFEICLGIEPNRKVWVGSIGYNIILSQNIKFYFSPTLENITVPNVDLTFKYKYPIKQYLDLTTEAGFGFMIWALPLPTFSFGLGSEFHITNDLSLLIKSKMNILLSKTDGDFSTGAQGFEKDINSTPPISLTMGISF